MRRLVRALVVVANAWLAGGCAGSADRVTVPSPSGPTGQAGSAPAADACDHSRAEWAIGQHATDALLEKARQAAGARTARFLKPGQSITMEYLASRLNLELDQKDVVRTVRCG
jgi:hypothetical protein